ncbi:MAG TPA: helix-turn-helix transcriptional regulator [Bauldia sp.]|nr:helix-turn-helix transcriptional regulator [Bauldia sp.]
MAAIVDQSTIEAEENLLIDFQFLIQELIMEKGLSRTQLAAKAGISKARLSQLFKSDANPTAKTFARILHALGETACVTTKRKFLSSRTPVNDPTEWNWDFSETTSTTAPADMGKTAQFVAVLRENLASNDNYSSLVVEWENGRQSISLKAA